MNVISGVNTKSGFAVVGHSIKIEVEVDGIYKETYNKQLTINKVIALLQCRKASLDSRSLVLHTLFPNG